MKKTVRSRFGHNQSFLTKLSILIHTLTSGRRKSLFDEQLLVKTELLKAETKSNQSRRGSLYANQRADDTSNEITFHSRRNSHVKTPNLSRTATPNLSRRGSYVNYEEKARLRTKTPTLRGEDFGVSPLLQNMSRRGSTIIGGDVL